MNEAEISLAEDPLKAFSPLLRGGVAVPSAPTFKLNCTTFGAIW